MRVKHVHGSIDLSAERIEARRHGLRPQLESGSRRGGHQRGNGPELEPRFMSEPLRSCPADAQSGEAPGTVAYHDAVEVRRSNAQPAEREVHEANDLGCVTTASLHVRSALRRRRSTSGDTGDLGRRVDSKPEAAHRSSSISRTSGSSPYVR